MTVEHTHSDAARLYLRELETALAAAPAELRAEIVDDVSARLQGLDDTATAERIAQLGDPRAIAADATAEADAEAADSAPRPAPSLTYPTITAVVLAVGWFVVPVIGWIAGLVMVAYGSGWSTTERWRAILWSAGAAVAGFVVGLLALRGSTYWPIGLAIFVIVPLVANIVIGVRLRRLWGLAVVP